MKLRKYGLSVQDRRCDRDDRKKGFIAVDSASLSGSIDLELIAFLHQED